jgi:hypothetical protein
MRVANIGPIRILILLSAASLMPPPAAAKVESFTDPKADFSQYKTFQWLPPRVLTKAGVDEDHPAAPVLKDAVGRQLTQKGLSEVAEGGDLQIQTYVLTELTPQLEALIFAPGFGDQGDIMTFGAPMATVGRYNKQGSLYLNLIDRRTKKSAWCAMESKTLPNRTLKPDELRSKLDKAAQNMFKKYPVKK